MKRITFVLVLLALLASFVPAQAMETKTYNVYASSGSPAWVLFQTYRQGDISVQATWTPTRKGSYILLAYHYTDPTQPPYYTRDSNYYCLIATYQTGTVNGNWTCYLPSAPAGYYAVEFKPYNSPVTVTVNVTAETNP